MRLAGASDPSRIAALDLIRGVAVLGILAVNAFSFAGPPTASYSPDWPHPGSMADHWVFAAVLVLFEGKMRALFTILFGASMLLFVRRAERKGRDGQMLQLRRLGWLALLGYLHYLLLWDGDILLLYAVIGCIALAFVRAPPLPLVLAGLVLFALWQGTNAVLLAPHVAAESAVRTGTATAAQMASHKANLDMLRERDARLSAEAALGWSDQVHARLADRPGEPLRVIVSYFGETLPFMLLGMALMASGFFSGAWRRRNLGLIATLGLGLGGSATLAFALWAEQRGYPIMAMQQAIHFMLSVPHLAMALGYAALLALATPRLLRTGFGQRLAAAGKMAFSNYIATSAIMGAAFFGWGLALHGTLGAAQAWLFVPCVWALMLAWSKPWLARFRQGPLEWLWRSLTEARMLPVRR